MRIRMWMALGFLASFGPSLEGQQQYNVMAWSSMSAGFEDGTIGGMHLRSSLGTVAGSGGAGNTRIVGGFLAPAFLQGGLTEIGPIDLQPRHVWLSQNYPNPFNPRTSVSFYLAEETAVRLSVYDLLGREVALLREGKMGVGEHRADWHAAGVGSGVYMIRLKAGTAILTRKIVLMR